MTTCDYVSRPDLPILHRYDHLKIPPEEGGAGVMDGGGWQEEGVGTLRDAGRSVLPAPWLA